jgi:hypothetical protein
MYGTKLHNVSREEEVKIIRPLISNQNLIKMLFEKCLDADNCLTNKEALYYYCKDNAEDELTVMVKNMCFNFTDNRALHFVYGLWLISSGILTSAYIMKEALYDAILTDLLKYNAIYTGSILQDTDKCYKELLGYEYSPGHYVSDLI